MYKKIMVPLDGSKLAECVVPHVEAIARGCETPEIVLVRAIEAARMGVKAEEQYSTESVKQWNKLEDENRKQTEDYLKVIAAKLTRDGVMVRTVVLPPGRPAEMIVEHANANGVDLIIIATHGRSGVSRWVMGSVAEKVMRASCVPVLMVRAPGCAPGI